MNPFAKTATIMKNLTLIEEMSNDPQYQKIFVGNTEPFTPEVILARPHNDLDLIGCRL
jgi:hypothetical protein